MIGQKPFYKSKTNLGLLTTVLPPVINSILSYLGYEGLDELVMQGVSDLVSFIGVLISFYGRVTAEKRLTLK